MRLDILSLNDSRTAIPSQVRPMWQVGAVLEAIAVRDVASGQLWLQLAQQRLPARLASGHSAGPLDGEQLKLRVLRTSPILALESVDTTNSLDPGLDALRRFLPRQTSPTPLLANLSWLARSAEQLHLLPKSVQQAMLQLWRTLPDSNSLQSPQQLSKALQCSGTFMESMLASQGGTLIEQALSQDYKANLLRLRQQLRGLQLEPAHAYLPPGPMPSLATPLSAMATGPASLAMLDGPADRLSELLQQIEGNLARIHSNQLLNDQVAQQGWLSWLIELPYLRRNRAELLRFKLSREERREAGASTAWQLEMALDLGQAGQLHALIMLHGRRLNIQLRSESAQLITSLNQALPELVTTLQTAGLDVARIVCLHGAPVDPAESRLTRLLDMHA